jgi:hypothetical protein
MNQILEMELTQLNLLSILEIAAILGSTITALAAIGALIVGITTIKQRTLSDRREHWWKRARWAFELFLSENELKQEVGISALEYLAGSELTGLDEAKLLNTVSGNMIGQTRIEEGRHESTAA